MIFFYNIIYILIYIYTCLLSLLLLLSLYDNFLIIVIIKNIINDDIIIPIHINKFIPPTFTNIVSKFDKHYLLLYYVWSILKIFVTWITLKIAYNTII